MTRPELAESLFRSGYNCAQSVVMAFAPDFGLSREEAERISAAFGGGFKLLRHRCGCICRIIRVYMVIYHNDSPSCRFIALFGMTIISRSCNIFNMFFP